MYIFFSVIKFFIKYKSNLGDEEQKKFLLKCVLKNVQGLEDISTYVQNCAKVFKTVKIQEDQYAMWHFWTGVLKWRVIKVKFNQELRSQTSRKLHHQDGGTNSDDPSSNFYSRIFNQEDYNEVVEHFKHCQHHIEQLKYSSDDEQIPTQEYLDAVGLALAEIFDLLSYGESFKRQTKTLLGSVWNLINEGHLVHAKYILDHYEKSSEIEENTVPGCLLKAELKLLKGHFILSGGLLCDIESKRKYIEGPLECFWSAVKLLSDLVKTSFSKNPHQGMNIL